MVPLQICAHCKSLVSDPGQAFCDYCGETLVCQPVEEREFTPLLLIAGIRQNLFLNRNTACRLFFRNLDASEISDVRLRLESRTAREAWEKTLPPIPRGLMQDYAGVAEFLPREAGDMVLVFILSFTDCRGARRRYEGELTMCIQDIAAGSQQAHITFNVTNSKLMGNDLSELIRMQGAEKDAGSQTPEGFRKIPIPLHLNAFTPGRGVPVRSNAATMETPASERNFVNAGGRYRLAFEGYETGRRVLILTRSSVAIGMKKYTSTPRVDLTLRLLPCRSEEQDPENWNKTRGISSPHATIQARHDHFVIRDEPASKNGLYLTGLSGGENTPLPSASEGGRLFQNRPGNAIPQPAPAGGEIRTALYQLAKGEWERLPERCEIYFGQQLIQLRAQTFRSATDELYALLLQRLGNAPELEYIIALRRLYIGNGPKCPLRVHAPDFPAIAGALEWNGAQWSLVAGADRPEVRLNDRRLARGESGTITGPSQIQIGPYRWSFDAAVVEDFTQV